MRRLLLVLAIAAITAFGITASASAALTSYPEATGGFHFDTSAEGWADVQHTCDALLVAGCSPGNRYELVTHSLISRLDITGIGVPALNTRAVNAWQSPTFAVGRAGQVVSHTAPPPSLTFESRDDMSSANTPLYHPNPGDDFRRQAYLFDTTSGAVQVAYDEQLTNFTRVPRAVTATLGQPLVPGHTYRLLFVMSYHLGGPYILPGIWPPTVLQRLSNVAINADFVNPPPSVTVNPASAVTCSTAQLNATVVPNPLAYAVGTSPSEVNFEYGRVGSNLVFTTPKQSINGSTSGVPVSQVVTGLARGSTYDVRAVITTPAGVSKSESVQFTTRSNCNAPTAVTLPAAECGVGKATLFGRVINDSTAQTPLRYYFEYGTTPFYGSSTPERSINVGSISVDVPGELITGLPNGPILHARIVATNDTGTTTGNDITFFPHPCGDGGG